MHFSTAKDLLDQAGNLHAGLARYYQRLAGSTGKESTEKEKVKMLLDYLARHEEKLAAELARFSQDTAAHIRNAWLTYELSDGFVKCIPPAKPVEGMDVNELINLAIQLDDCIIDLYQLVAMECELPEAREAFLNLVAQERQEKMLMVRQAMRLNDM